MTVIMDRLHHGRPIPFTSLWPPNFRGEDFITGPAEPPWAFSQLGRPLGITTVIPILKHSPR